MGSFVTARIEVLEVRLRGKLIKCRTTLFNHGFDYPGTSSAEDASGGLISFRKLELREETRGWGCMSVRNALLLLPFFIF